jgi:hypothetical protein
MAKVFEVAGLEPKELRLVIVALKSALQFKGSGLVLDFGNPEALTRINSWVSEKTGGKIESILNSLDPLALLVAVNAVYFIRVSALAKSNSNSKCGGQECPPHTRIFTKPLLR